MLTYWYGSQELLPMSRIKAGLLKYHEKLVSRQLNWELVMRFKISDISMHMQHLIK